MPDPIDDKGQLRVEEKASPPEASEVEELRDRFLRLAAEFDNWKKRAQKGLADAETRGQTAVWVELLPVLDNVERALEQVKREDPIAKGVKLVYRQLLGLAERLGVRRFDPVGEPFDPHRHQALAEMETREMPAGTVAQVHAPGYLHDQQVLRPAVVTVSKSPPASESQHNDS